MRMTHVFHVSKLHSQVVSKTTIKDVLSKFRTTAVESTSPITRRVQTVTSRRREHIRATQTARRPTTIFLVAVQRRW